MSTKTRITPPDPKKHEKIQEFIEELSGFAATAEDTLKKIEENLETNKGLFSVFTARMIAIRGTADQLVMPNISQIAGLSEEISVKGSTANGRPVIRKCVGSLWDALTTVKHLLVNYQEETSEEQGILIHRLEATLKSLGGSRDKFSEDEITALIEKQRAGK